MESARASVHPSSALLQGAVLLLAVACGGEGSRPSGGADDPGPPVAPADLAATCGDGWVEACEAAGCDPASPAWAGCRVNGWEGYATPASCPLETGHDGDDRVPCAPDPEEGFQLHFGPEDPSDAAAVARHQVQPGESTIECVYLPLPNDETRYLGQLIGRTRPGVHHTQLRFVDRAATTSADSEPCLPFGGEYVHMGQTREFQVPDLTVPNPSPGAPTAGGLDLAGGALELAPGRVVALELHYINGGDVPLLREGWIDFYFQKPERVERVLRGLMLIGAGIRVEPRSTGVVRRACESDRPRTVTHLQGHSHEGATRFSIWVRRGSTGALEPVYESYDPLEPALLTFSSAVTNQPPRPEALSPGGASGELRLAAGDALVWECEIPNDRDTPVTDGGPDALGNQMCYVFGNFAPGDPGDTAGWPCGASTEAPY